MRHSDREMHANPFSRLLAYDAHANCLCGVLIMFMKLHL